MFNKYYTKLAAKKYLEIHCVQNSFLPHSITPMVPNKSQSCPRPSSVFAIAKRQNKKNI